MLKKINICYLTYQTFPSNKANSIQTISNIKYFIKNNCNVELVFPLREKASSSVLSKLQKHYGFTENFKVSGQLHNYPFGKIHIFEKILFLFSHVLWSRKICKKFLKKEKKYDFYFTRSEWVFYFLSKKNIKVVYECHQLSKINKFIVPKAIKKKQSFVIFLNSHLLNAFSKYQLDRSKYIILHNGVDDDLFLDNITPINNRIIFVGNLLRFGRSRGLEQIIRLFSEKKYLDYQLIIIGGPNSEVDKFKKLTSKSNIKNVTFLGQLERVRAIKELQLSSIGLLLSLDNDIHSKEHASPLKYFEYLRGDLNVVATENLAHKNLPFNEKIAFFDISKNESFFEAISSFNTKKINNSDLHKTISLDTRIKKILEFIALDKIARLEGLEPPTL